MQAEDRYFQKTIRKGNRAVIISANTPAGPFTSSLYINCDMDNCPSHEPTSVGIRAKAKTLKGAEKQAERMLAR